MKRSVLLTIDDDRVTHLMVVKVAGVRGYDPIKVTVPPDDQLTRDIHMVTHDLLDGEAYEAGQRLRAAFHLDEGSET